MKWQRTKRRPKFATLTVMFTILGIIWLQALAEPTGAETREDHSQNKEVKHNRLINESSPYLLQHATNPIDWYPWGEEAFEKAKKEGKPIFLSIGYSTCHWCHVMERESFSDAEVAALLNRDFVSIKVDREERPDIDQVYMTVTQTLTGQGGLAQYGFSNSRPKAFFCGHLLSERKPLGSHGVNGSFAAGGGPLANGSTKCYRKR